MDKHDIVKQRFRKGGIRYREYIACSTFIIDFVVSKKYAVVLTNDDMLSRIEEIERKKLIPYKLRTDYMFEEDLAWLIELNHENSTLHNR